MILDVGPFAKALEVTVSFPRSTLIIIFVLRQFPDVLWPPFYSGMF